MQTFYAACFSQAPESTLELATPIARTACVTVLRRITPNTQRYCTTVRESDPMQQQHVLVRLVAFALTAALPSANCGGCVL